MKIVADSHIPYIHAFFSAYGELVLKPGRAISHDDMKEADMLIVRSITHVDEALLVNTPVKFVGSVTAGADHLDTKWLDKAGIAWCVAVGFNAPPVADYVVSVIAALQKKGLLAKPGMKAAVIGVGNVGRLVAKRLELFHFDVTLCDPLRAENESNFFSTPIEALEGFDLITLHVPLTRTGDHPTFHFINEAFLRKQKAGCVLINASRGAVINTQALLEHGRHLYWCFDVWEHEPRISKEVLKQALIATPHIAGYSVQSKIRGIDMIYRLACEQNIIAPQPMEPILMPRQQLTLTEHEHCWQDLVLGIFNPLVITAMMHTILLPADEQGPLFDEMRNQFNYRNELSYTSLSGSILENEKPLLTKLGIKFN